MDSLYAHVQKLQEDQQKEIAFMFGYIRELQEQHLREIINMNVYLQQIQEQHQKHINNVYAYLQQQYIKFSQQDLPCLSCDFFNALVRIEKMLPSTRGINNNHSDLHTEPNSNPSILSRTRTPIPIPSNTKQSVSDFDFNQDSDTDDSHSSSDTTAVVRTIQMLVSNAVTEKDMNNSYSDWHYIPNVDVYSIKMNNIITEEGMHKNGVTEEKTRKNAATEEEIQKNAVTEEKMHRMEQQDADSDSDTDSDFDTDADEYYTLLHVRPRNRYQLQQFRKFWTSRR